MRSFDWARHDEVRPYPPGSRVPLWIKLLWVPSLAWLVFVVHFAWSRPWLTHQDAVLLPAFGIFVGSLAVSIALGLAHMRRYNPRGWQTFKVIANALLVIYWADKAIHAAVHHYAPNLDDD